MAWTRPIPPFAGPPGLALLAIALLVAGCAPAASSKQKVTLRNGETYQVDTVRGLPVRFASDQIRVNDVGITALLKPDSPDAPPWVWVFTAELRDKGRFGVTVTTALDKTASTSFEVVGPGRIGRQFFPQADYPLVWQDIDQPGTHWFPFHFVFVEKESGKRFELTQWAQIDDGTMSELRALIEKARKEAPTKP
jgi:hypothetical protein